MGAKPKAKNKKKRFPKKKNIKIKSSACRIVYMFVYVRMYHTFVHLCFVDLISELAGKTNNVVVSLSNQINWNPATTAKIATEQLGLFNKNKTKNYWINTKRDQLSRKSIWNCRNRLYFPVFIDSFYNKSCLQITHVWRACVWQFLALVSMDDTMSFNCIVHFFSVLLLFIIVFFFGC